MKALVTGASGFIGSTLIEDLVAQGVEVYALMRKSSSASNLNGLRFHRIEGDLGDEGSLRRALAGIPGLDYVFHLAGATTGPNREYYFRHNAQGTGHLALAVAERCSSLKRFVYVSSLAAAGPALSMSPRSENETEAPVSAYGESKREGELQVLRFKGRFPVTIIRPPLVYGPRDQGVLVIIKTVSKNLMPLLPGSGPGGEKYYSGIHSKDLCRGIVLGAWVDPQKVSSGEVFYLAGDEVFSYRQFLGAIATSLGVEPFSFRLPKAALYAAAGLGSALGYVSKKTFALNLDKLGELLPDYWIFSNEKAKKLLGFSPHYTLQNGMNETIQWYKKENWL